MASSLLTAPTGRRLATLTFGSNVSPLEFQYGLLQMLPWPGEPASLQMGAPSFFAPNGRAAGSIWPRCQQGVSTYWFQVEGIHSFRLTVVALLTGWAIETTRSHRGDCFFIRLKTVRPRAWF